MATINNNESKNFLPNSWKNIALTYQSDTKNLEKQLQELKVDYKQKLKSKNFEITRLKSKYKKESDNFMETIDNLCVKVFTLTNLKNDLEKDMDKAKKEVKNLKILKDLDSSKNRVEHRVLRSEIDQLYKQSFEMNKNINSLILDKNELAVYVNNLKIENNLLIDEIEKLNTNLSISVEQNCKIVKKLYKCQGDYWNVKGKNKDLKDELDKVGNSCKNKLIMELALKNQMIDDLEKDLVPNFGIASKRK